MTKLLICNGIETLSWSSAILEVYQAAFSQPSYTIAEQDLVSFAQDTLPRHSQREGFRCVIARSEPEERIVGFGYGYTGQKGQYWTEAVSKALPAEIVKTWLPGHFEFVELAVLPSCQRQGIGSQIHDTLLSDLPHRYAMLSTLQSDTPAVRLYQKKGWKTLFEHFRFPGATADYLIMGKEL